MCFRSSNFGISWPQDLGGRFGPRDRSHHQNPKLFPPPRDIKQLQRFLGLVNFYRRFLPNCAQVLHPLTDLLKGGLQTLRWTATAQESFQKVKRLLAAAVLLRHPSPTAELSLATDPSDTHIGGVMQQKSGNHWRPLGFFSRKLTGTESRDSTFDCELLAAHAAIKHIRHFCEGCQFQLWTYHKPLVSALTRVSVPMSPRQHCQLVFISEFNIQMLYLPSLKNVVADFLSRPPPPQPTGNVTTAAVADPVGFEAMASDQNSCAEMQRLLGGTSLKVAFRGEPCGDPFCLPPCVLAYTRSVHLYIPPI
jgi:hypothetical protein